MINDNSYHRTYGNFKKRSNKMGESGALQETNVKSNI